MRYAQHSSAKSPVLGALVVHFLAALLAASACGQPHGLWLEPAATRELSIPSWQEQSTSPFGGTRIGGSDRRPYAISPDGSVLATIDSGGWQLELFDLQTGQSAGRFGKIDEPVVIAFSPDGKTLVAANWDTHRGGTVELWDVERRERLRSLDEGVNFTPFTSLAFSSDGKTLALASKSRGRPVAIHLWDVASGEELRRIGESPQPAARAGRVLGRRTLLSRTIAEPFGPVALAPDGRSVAVAAEELVTLLEVATGGQRAVIGRLPARSSTTRGSIDTPARAITWLDSRLVAVGCSDGLIRLYDVASNRRLPPLSGHAASVVALRVLPDGKTLLSVGLDRRLCKWDLTAARQAAQPPPSALTPEVGGKLIAELTKDDPLAAHRAQLTLAHGSNVVQLTEGELTPEPTVNKGRLARLAADVGSDDYNQRRRAAAELRKFGPSAVPALRKAAAENELVSEFLTKFQTQFPPRAQTLRLSLVEVLAESGSAASVRKLTELAKGEEDSPLTERAKQALAFLEREVTVAPAEAAPEVLWADLASDDPRRAWRAMQAVATQSAVRAAIRNQVEAAKQQLDKASDPQRLERLIAELDADEFATRDAASEALQQLGPAIHSTLHQALARADSAEVKLRLEQLLKDSAGAPPSVPRLQAERAAEALELALEESRP